MLLALGVELGIREASIFILPLTSAAGSRRRRFAAVLFSGSLSINDLMNYKPGGR